MNFRKLPSLCLTLALGTTAGCNAVQTANLDSASLVDRPEDKQVLAITGVTPFGKSYAIGDWSGSYAHSASGTTILNAIESRRSQSSFTLQGPGFAQTVTAECGAESQGAILQALASNNADRTLSCVFEAGGQQVGSLTLGPDHKSVIGALSLETGLSGTVRFDGTSLSIKSQHRAANAAISTDRPLGYTLRSGGQTAALIDLNQKRATLPQTAQTAAFQSALVGVLALTFLQDVTDSDPLR